MKDEEAEALTPCVSKYGLMSDAYSVGVTLGEIVTGVSHVICFLSLTLCLELIFVGLQVPPGQDITTYVKLHRKELPKPQSKLSKLCFGSPKGPYPIQLRLFGELPKPCSSLISNLMNYDPATRMSVREAQEHEYIGGYDRLEHGDVVSRRGSVCVPLQNIAAFK